jgi:hypothetical protein
LPDAFSITIAYRTSISSLQTGLLQDAIQSARRQIVARLASDGNATRLGLVLVLAVATACCDEDPTVIQKHSKNLADFHQIRISGWRITASPQAGCGITSKFTGAARLYRAASGGMNCSAPFLLGTMAGDVFAKHTVHSRLPTFTRGFEVGDDLGAVPYGNEQLLVFGFWPAS